jgi:glycerol transport system substrate-binding protein
VAQQIFWYTAFLADMVKPAAEGNNTVDVEGNTRSGAPRRSRTVPYWELTGM